MKKIVSVTLLIAVITAFAGCGATEPSKVTEDTEVVTEESSEVTDETSASSESPVYDAEVPRDVMFKTEVVDRLTSYHSGEMGYLLKSAQGVYDLFQFIEYRDFSRVDPEQAQANLSSALDELSEEELNDFVYNYRFCKQIVDASLRDRTRVPALFDDIDATDDMRRFLEKDTSVNGWNNLSTIIDNLTGDMDIEVEDL